MGWEFILAWTFLTDFCCWVWTIFKFSLFPMYFLSSMLFVKVYLMYFLSSMLFVKVYLIFQYYTNLNPEEIQEFPVFQGQTNHLISLHFYCLTSKIAKIIILLSCMGNENTDFLFDQELLESRSFFIHICVAAPGL